MLSTENCDKRRLCNNLQQNWDVTFIEHFVSSPILPMKHFVIFMEGIEGADLRKKNTNYVEEED